MDTAFAAKWHNSA